MKPITKLLPFIFLFLMNLSCDTTTTIDLPKRPQHLVLNCIAQDSTYNRNLFNWVVSLSLSKGILESIPFDPVSNAVIAIYENNKLLVVPIESPFNKGSYYFQNSYPTPGKSYRIEATAPPYGTVSASFIQPMPVMTDALEIKILGTNPVYEYSRDVQFRVFLTDPAGENYYAISIKRKTENSPFPGGAAGLNLAFIDPAYQEYNTPYTSTLIFKDTYFDGQKTYLDFKSIISDYPDDPPLNFYSVTLNNLTKEHYDYLKTAYIQASTRNDPFAQPIQVVNNIKNGYGIFTGFTQTVKTIEFAN